MAESWGEVMTAPMRHGYQVYAIDLLGFGRPGHVDVDCSIALQIKIPKQFFDSQNLVPAGL